MAVTGTPTTGNDVLQSDDAADSIDALAGNDVLIGNGGNDTLNGNTGDDTMIGGAGDDSYVVDSVNDVVSETAGNGNDTVNTSVNFTLGANVENLIARGTDNLVLTGNGLANQITGNTGNNVFYGGDDSTGAAADTLTGLGGNDTYIIRDGVDDVIVEIADDPLNGTTGGSDTVQVVASSARTSYALAAGAAIEVLQASDGSSTQALNLTGNAFAQFIVGNNGANVLDGGTNPTGTANDTLVGLGGDDTYIVRNVRSTVVEADGAGNDTVNIIATGNGSYTFAQSIETINASASTATTLNITGGAGNQTITGSAAGANRINGGGGTDSLIGGTGNDTFTVDSFDDTVTDGGGGRDRVIAGSSYALGAASGIEYFTAAGTTLSAAVGQGDGTLNLGGLNTTVTSNFFVGDNATGQYIFGDAGNNILNGRISATLGTGEALGQINDTLVGGNGSDTYRVYSQTDRVVEDTNNGTADFIFTSQSYSLAANDTAVAGLSFVDDTQSTTTIDDNGQTRTFASFIGALPQQIEVLSAADQAAGTTGVAGMTLTGNAYGQIIVGDFNDNVINDGGSSITVNGVTTQYQDQLAGLGGNDTYNVTAQNTTVNEGIGNGTDTVNVTLAAAGGFFGLIDQAEVEFLNAGGNLTIGLSGNQFNQVITGNGADNTFDGRGGQDTLVGGAGNDTYFITSAQAAANTTIIEATATGGGTADAVSTSVSFDLAATNAAYVASAGAAATGAAGIIGIEQIYVTNGLSTDNINLTGNGAAQFIVGNYGNNILNGDNDTGTTDANGVFTPTGTAAGDTLQGLFGDDVYRVYSQNDVIIETAGQGNDTVFASGTSYQLRTGNSIEVLSAANQSSTTGMQLIGNELNQTIIGTAAGDTIWGGSGNDTLRGDGGNDTFGFAQSGATNVDTLADFAPGDFIGLYTGTASSTAFATQSFGALLNQGTSTTGLDQNEFVNGTTATGAFAQILYNQSTGQVFYDADGTGSGAAVLFAQLAPNTGLGFNDFTLLSTTPVITPAPAVA